MSVRFRATIEGVVEGGRGIGAELMKDPVVLIRIQTAVGLETVPGTPNVCNLLSIESKAAVVLSAGRRNRI
jgi:hypothetical protein